MNNTIEKLITLLTEQLENAGDISTGQGIKQDMNQQADDVSGQPDGFRKDPVKELHDHEDRVAEKTAKETKEVVSKLLTYHRKATKPLSTEILKTIEKSNVLLRKVNDGIDKQSNEIKESYSRIEQLNAAQADENRVNLALLEKLVNNTAPKPRKIREDTLNVKITNFDDFKGGEGDSKQVAKLTPRSSKSEGADWVKWLAGAGLIAYILKEAFKGFDFGQWIKDQFQEMFERGPDENISGGVHGTKWAARMLKPILAWGTKAGIKATWATIKGVTGISTLQKMASKVVGTGKPTVPVDPGKPVNKGGPAPDPGKPKGGPAPDPGKPVNKGGPPSVEKPKPNLKLSGVKPSVPISSVGTAVEGAADLSKSTAAAAKTMGAKGGISLGRRLVSNTPYLGIGISTAMGAWRQSTGDQTGANLEYLSAALNAGSGFGGPAGLASMASSFAVDGYIVYRDWKRSKHWEELMEANEGYLERVKILRELTDGGKSVSDLSTDELKSILGEENWEKFRKNRGSKNLRYMAEKGVREFKAELDAEKESREKMVQEVMDSMGGAFSEADRPAIQAILMSQALAYSKEGQSDAIREQYAEDFSNIIQNSGKMEDLMQEYASFSRDSDIGKRTSGRRNLFKGNIALEWGKGYDAHVVLDADGKKARLVKDGDLAGGLEEREYVFDKHGNHVYREWNGTAYKLMKKTGRRLTKDDPLLAQFYEERDKHMAPKVGKRTADSLKAAGYWPAFLEQMPELEGKTLAEQEYVLGMMVVKGWSLENTMGGLLGVNLKGPKHTKAFLDKVAKMAEGVRTGEGISRGYVTNVMKDRIRHAQSGTKAIGRDGTANFTGYLPTAGGHVGIQSMMDGETPVPEDVKQWFVESVNSPPGSLQRQIVENMDHDVRRKLAGWEHMDSTGKRRFDEYWNDREAAEQKYEKLMRKYASLTDTQVENAKSQGAWTEADQTNLMEARLYRGDSKDRKEFLSLAGYGAGHYGGMAYGGIQEAEEGLYFQRLLEGKTFVGMHEGEDYNVKAGDLRHLSVSDMAELTPEQLEFAQALQSKEKGQAYYLRNIKGKKDWVAPRLPAGRYIDVNQVEQFVAPTPLDSYPLSPDEEYLPLQNLLRDSRSTDPNAGAELLLKEQVDETKQMNEAIRQFMSESNPTNQSNNTQVNNSNINTTITTEGATQIEKNKGAFRSSPGSSIWTGTRTY